jgi:hypothetical protein
MNIRRRKQFAQRLLLSMLAGWFLSGVINFRLEHLITSFFGAVCEWK